MFYRYSIISIKCLRKITEQKLIVDTQKIQGRESKHITTENNSFTNEDSKGRRK